MKVINKNNGLQIVNYLTFWFCLNLVQNIIFESNN